MHDMGNGQGGRGAVIMRVMEARKAIPVNGSPGEEQEDTAEDSGAPLSAKEFIAAMIPHHEEAIRMCKAFLDGPDGDDPKLRSMAESIISSQGEEIDTLKGMSGGDSGNEDY